MSSTEAEKRKWEKSKNCDADYKRRCKTTAFISKPLIKEKDVVGSKLIVAKIKGLTHKIGSKRLKAIRYKQKVERRKQRRLEKQRIIHTLKNTPTSD